MSRDIWDPRQYRAYAAERARPFFDLLNRVDVDAPTYVVDLGCGSGERTADLAARWPQAAVEGIDSSPRMIAEADRLARRYGSPAAREAGSHGRQARHRQGSTGRSGASREAGPEHAGSRLRFSVGEIAEWAPERPVDVIVSSAALHWVPGHQRMLARWVNALTPGGRLAFTMPGNFDAPSHVILRELCGSERWRDRLAPVIRHDIVSTPARYAELLTGLGCRVDVWETTYLQVLPGDDPVLDWLRGTTLRPVLDVLRRPEQGSGRDEQDFLAELGTRLRAAYPKGPHGTVFPFRRIFVVAGPPSARTGAGARSAARGREPAGDSGAGGSTVAVREHLPVGQDVEQDAEQPAQLLDVVGLAGRQLETGGIGLQR